QLQFTRTWRKDVSVLRLLVSVGGRLLPQYGRLQRERPVGARCYLPNFAASNRSKAMSGDIRRIESTTQLKPRGFAPCHASIALQAAGVPLPTAKMHKL